MQAKAVLPKRSRGRPHGGGNTADESCEALLDAAERSLLHRGYRASTMEAIAREAGYTRTIIYRHFATRDELMDAVMMRRAAKLSSKLFRRQSAGADVAGKLTDAVVVVVTEVVHDPICMILTEQTEKGTIANLPARMSLAAGIEAMLVGLQHGRGKPFLRNGLRPVDAAHFLITSTLGILAGLVPGSEDADQIRRYVRVFILPSILADAPPVEAVFEPL